MKTRRIVMKTPAGHPRSRSRLTARCRRASAGAVSILLLGLSACSAQIGEADGSTAASDDLPPGAVPKIAGMVPEEVRSTGVLKVASEVYPPAVIVPKGGGDPTGFEIETAREVAKILGLEYQPKIIPFDSLIASLQANRYDISFGMIALTDERIEVLSFVQNHNSKDGFLVAADSEITKVTDPYDLCGLKLSVLVGSIEELRARDIDTKCEKASDPALTITTFKDQASADLAVETGRADIGFSSATQAAYNAEHSDERLRFVEQPWEVETYGTGAVIADTDYQDEMAAAVEAALDHMIRTGQQGKILDEHNYGLGKVTDAVTFLKGSELEPVVLD